MSDFEITFDERTWEQDLLNISKQGILSGGHFLARMEGEPETEVDEAFDFLESRNISLDISDLPAVPGGEAALRLRQEVQFVAGGMKLSDLKSEDPLRLYLEELAHVPACGDENVLAQEVMEGKNSGEQLMNLCLSRVVECAAKYVGRGVLLLDLIQEGSMALWQAIYGYTGGDFADYRDYHIEKGMLRQILLQCRNAGVGQKLRQALEDYRAVDERLLSELGRNATLEEIAQELHMEPLEAEQVRKMLDSARMMNRVKSQETKEEEPEDEQHVEDTALFRTRQRIQELLSGLSEQDAKLLTLRFGLEGGLPLNPEDTGRKLGLTPNEVLEREAAALALLRNS